MITNSKAPKSAILQSQHAPSKCPSKCCSEIFIWKIKSSDPSPRPALGPISTGTRRRPVHSLTVVYVRHCNGWFLCSASERWVHGDAAATCLANYSSRRCPCRLLGIACIFVTSCFSYCCSGIRHRAGCYSALKFISKWYAAFQSTVKY